MAQKASLPSYKITWWASEHPLVGLGGSGTAIRLLQFTMIAIFLEGAQDFTKIKKNEIA